uniref:CCHC-type domain-containing protein n=1 Tax=Fagus sylvatica TaxID=28930 RepID=A0A2N9HIV3_FAGSY
MDTDMSDRLKVKIRASGDKSGHSHEDGDSGRRSNKKMIDTHAIPTGEMDIDRVPIMGGEALERKEPISPLGVRIGVSYKESLLGELPRAYEQAFFGHGMEDDGGISLDDDDDIEPPEEGEVVVKFSRELKQRIREPWSTSLIIKVFGRSVGYMFLVNKLKYLWKVTGNFSCVDLGLDLGSLISRASEAVVSSVAVWVRLSELPVEYYQKDSLMHIGKELGPVLREDYNTAIGTRGRFASICIQLDLDKPQVRTVRIGKTKLAVVYEGIGLLCFHCGKIGHQTDRCPNRCPDDINPPTLPVDVVSHPAKAAGVDADTGKDKLVKEGSLSHSGLSKNQGRSSALSNGKKIQVKEPNKSTSRVPSSSEPVGPNSHLEAQTSLQSQAHAQSLEPVSNLNLSSFPQLPPTPAAPKQHEAALISLRPQIPTQHDKHQMRTLFHAVGLVQDPRHRKLGQKSHQRFLHSALSNPPLLTDMVWLQEISPFWNFQADIPRIDGVHCPVRIRSQPSPELRFTQYLEEVYCATLPEFEERKVILSAPIKFYWQGNSITKDGSSGEVHSLLCDNDLMLREDKRGESVVQFLNRSNNEQPLGDVAREGLERNGSGRQSVSINQPSIYINSPAVLVLTETRLGGNRAVDLAKTLPFDGFLCTNTIGFAGGIWVMWNSDLVDVEHLCSTEQEIHVSVKVRGSNTLWLLSAIYASPRRFERRILWNNLSVIAELHNLPWVMVRDFNDILSCDKKWGAWASPASNLAGTFAIFTALVSAWNKLVFGNIFQRKKRVLARMSGVQGALASNPSDSLSRLEKSLREQYLNILNLEEDFWALKSRVGWVNGFSDLFTTSHVSSMDEICLPLWAPRISDAEALILLTPVTARDVKDSLWSFKPFKAPGPDGLHPGFFQRCWPQVGESVVKEVCHIFSSGRMPEYLNKTLIALIPKCNGPETLNQFRPISLCNTVYKIVTKIIVSRIRPLLSNLISPFQTAFIPGRRGVDNVIITQELIHSLHKKKGRKGFFILKIDLEKAYDRLEWSFIREVLLFFNFPTRILVNIWDSLFRLNGRNARDFRFIVEKVQAKLSNWKSKLLSSAGKVVLIQAVTSTIPAYYMQNAAFPSSICSELDKINKNFLWGSTEEKKKMNMVGWDKICRPKKDGGLGLSAAKPRNIALLAKLNWRLVEEKDSLWAKTLLAKYCPNGPLEINERTSRSGSSNWRGLKMGHEIFRQGLCCVIRNGHLVSFWHDTWVGNRPLREAIQGPIPPFEDCFCVVDVIEGEDSIAWDSSDGGFSLGKAYQLARNHQNVVNGSKNSMWLWKVKTSPRIVFFLWQCYHDSVPVWDTLASPEFFYLVDFKQSSKNLVPILVKWIPPSVNWAKLNTDGLVMGELGLAGGGALDLEIPNLEIEMDSAVAVKLLHSTNSSNAFLSSIVNDCRYLLERFEAYTLKHIYREANGCADTLAKAGYVQHSDFLLYTSAPAHVLEALDFDISVATCSRLVSA